ncbi:MAG: TatD DNase family protein [Bradymonadia bacterium]|jgi:TatD DNase family protein
MIDSHCHVYASQFGDDVEVVLQRAREAGVRRSVIIGAGGTTELCRDALALAETHDDVFCTAGFHPHDARAVTPEALAELEELAKHPRVVAIGEMGLDYFYDHSPRDVQEQVFRAQIEIAKRLAKPIVIHNRASDEDMMRIMRDAHAEEVGGVVHCFTSSWELAETAIELGFFIGFTGIVSFKSAQNVRDVLLRVPHDRIVVETDSPYLAPTPFRGKRNEPAYVVHVAEAVAETLGLSLEEVDAMTDANTCRLYGLVP